MWSCAALSTHRDSIMWSCAARHIKAAYKVSTQSLYSKSLLKVSTQSLYSKSLLKVSTQSLYSKFLLKVSLMLVRRALVIYLHKHSSFRLRRPIFELQNLGL